MGVGGKSQHPKLWYSSNSDRFSVTEPKIYYYDIYIHTLSLLIFHSPITHIRKLQ